MSELKKLSRELFRLGAELWDFIKYEARPRG